MVWCRPEWRQLLDLCGRGACGVCPGSPELKAVGTAYRRFTNSPITRIKMPACGGRTAGQGYKGVHVMTRHTKISANHFSSSSRSRRSIRALTYLFILLAAAAGITTQPANALPANSTCQWTVGNDRSPSVIEVRVNRWYEGGTLHRATYRQWSRATPRNRLATASDWAAAALGAERVRPIGMDGLKVYATSIVTCVNNARTPEVMENEVAEFAAVCMIMMGMR